MAIPMPTICNVYVDEGWVYSEVTRLGTVHDVLDWSHHYVHNLRLMYYTYWAAIILSTNESTPSGLRPCC